MSDLSDSWQAYLDQFVKRGHLKPTTGDIIEWLLGLPLIAIFIMWGEWWALVLALTWWRLLIPQWGVPEYLRWED